MNSVLRSFEERKATLPRIDYDADPELTQTSTTGDEVMARSSLFVGLLLMTSCIGSLNAGEGARVVKFYGYDDCIRLENSDVQVTLCPAAGGRILEYSRSGKNVLYLPKGDEGWTYQPDQPNAKRGNMTAGRFDIGPEKVVRRGPLLWMGRWTGEITGDRSAKLTSQRDPQSGVQLLREFNLASDSSRLTCTQTIQNVSDREVDLCHWSRTFAVGKGIAIVPRSPLGRFPNGYVMYTNGANIDIVPEDPNIEVTDSEVLIKQAPRHPKLGFDSMTGWLAYLAPSDQLFLKRFRTYPRRAYNEVAGLTVSVWYPKDRPTVELEPIGPAERLRPGEQASFTEEWWLMDYSFPQSLRVDMAELRKTIEAKTLPPNE